MAGRHEENATTSFDLEESPFDLPPIEGLPFDDDSEEARAIDRVLEEAKRKREAITD